MLRVERRWLDIPQDLRVPASTQRLKYSISASLSVMALSTRRHPTALSSDGSSFFTLLTRVLIG